LYDFGVPDGDDEAGDTAAPQEGQGIEKSTIK